MVWVMVVVRVMVRVRVESSVRVLIFSPEPSKECVKVSHVIFECRVINHHPVYLGPIKAFMLFSMPGTIIDSSPFARSR